MPSAADVEVAEDLDFQRRQWRLQRLAWIVVAAILIGAFLGVFGDGPLARASAISDDGRLEVEYQRFERHRSPAALRVTAQPASGEEAVDIWVSRSFAEDQGFETVHPEPESVTAAGDRYVFEFAVERGEREVHITFDLRPDGIGWVRASVGLVDGGAITFRQFVFP